MQANKGERESAHVTVCVYECVTVAHFEIECRILILLNEILCPNSTLPMPPVNQPHTLSPSLYALFFLSFSPFSRERGRSQGKKGWEEQKNEKNFSPVLKRQDDFRVGRWSLLKQQEHDNDHHQGVSHCVAHHGRGVPGRPVVLCCRIVKSK